MVEFPWKPYDLSESPPKRPRRTPVTLPKWRLVEIDRCANAECTNRNRDGGFYLASLTVNDGVDDRRVSLLLCTPCAHLLDAA